MDTGLVEQIKHLPLDDLYAVESLIQEEISKNEIKNRIKRIKEKVERNGYYCTTFFSNEIDGINKMKLSYYFNIKASRNRVNSISDIQDEWVKELGFEYRLGNDINNMHIWNDIHIITGTRGYIEITVYYLCQPCPPVGSVIRVINEDGDVQTIEIKDDMNWDDYKFIICPGCEEPNIF